MPPELYVRWRRELIGLSLHGEKLMQAQDCILKAMADLGISCAILKGSSLAALYPDAQMRPLGDIDLLVGQEDIANACAVLEDLGYCAPQSGHPFHIDFHKNGITVELHRAVSEFPNTSGGKNARRIMEECLRDVETVQMDGHCFPVLRPCFQAVSLLAHMQRHMLEGGVGLRQFCDWAVFAASIPPQRFANEILPVLEDCGLKRFACVLTRSCVEYLHMDADKVSWAMQADAAAAAALMDEFLRSGNFGQAAPEDISEFLVETNGSRREWQALFLNLNQRAKRHFPIAERVPVLLPVFWVYLPVRYVWRIMMGRRNKKSIAKSLTVAQNRNRLYRQLGLFETETDSKG